MTNKNKRNCNKTKTGQTPPTPANKKINIPSSPTPSGSNAKKIKRSPCYNFLSKPVIFL